MADRLSRSRITYVIPATYLLPYVRTSPNVAKRDLDQPIHDSRRALLHSSLMEPLMRGAGYSQSSGGGSNLTSVMPLGAGRRLVRSARPGVPTMPTTRIREYGTLTFHLRFIITIMRAPEIHPEPIHLDRRKVPRVVDGLDGPNPSPWR